MEVERARTEADGTAMCKAIAGGSVWPDADLVSLWSQNPYVSDDQINSDETTCDGADGSYGANCMGAPCYKLEGNMGDDSDGCQMACLCPIGAGELEPTFYDDALATDFTDQCFQATTVSTSWTPSLKQVNTLVSTLVKAGKDSAQQAANCDCTVSTAC